MIKNTDAILSQARNHAKEIIGRYLQLKRSGVNFTASCPFHNEKTASFVVSPQKGIYKCFGCGQGGDPIHLLMEHEGLTFPEALETAATIIGLRVEYAEGENKTEVIDQARRRKERRASQAAHLKTVWDHAFIRRIQQGEIIQLGDIETQTLHNYLELEGRLWQSKTISQFEVRIAANDNLICRHYKDSGLELSILEEIGLVKSADRGRYDYFKQRLIFPIRDHRGQLVGLAGRRLKTSDPKYAKYLNSPDSLLYQKSQILYGLNLAVKAMREGAKAYLVEGYTDVMRMHEHGFTTAVASCGTAFTLDQAKLLKRFTDTVLILRDGDEAGRKASSKDVETAIKAGLQAKICILPEGEDPESYLAKRGTQALKDYLDAKSQDGLIWRVMEEWDEQDQFKRSEAYRVAARLLNHLQSDLHRDEYIRSLAGKGKPMGAVTTQLKRAVRDQQNQAVKKNGRRLTPEQQHDAIHYGIFIDNDRFHLCQDANAGTGTEISNFCIEPIMLVVGREESQRVMRIRNTYGHELLADMDSKIFTDFLRFSAYIEGQGNFMYNEQAKTQHHTKIKRMVYDKMKTVYPIYTMGQHKAGFYTWGNGVTDNQGKFWPVNEYGLVGHGDANYFIRAHAQIGVHTLADDEEDTLKDQRSFAYVHSPQMPSVKEWSRLMVETHGENGMIAIAWAITAIYRDIIYPKTKFFPHLHAFGPPRSGKSFLGWSIQYLFGADPRGPAHFINDTVPFMWRLLAYVKNGVVWIDEVQNDADRERFEVIKKAYDGKGKGKAKTSYGHAMSTTQVNSAVYLSGQTQLTKDNAAFTRVISLTVAKKERSDEQLRSATQLRSIEETGCLTQLISRLQKYRSLIQESWFTQFDDMRSEWRYRASREGLELDDRVIGNYTIMLCIFKIISQQEEFAFSLQELQDFAYRCMVDQLANMATEDEAGTFWQIFNYLLTDHRIWHGQDLIVDRVKSEKFYGDAGTRGKMDREMTWAEPQKLVYINFARLHGLYMEQHQRQRRTEGQQLASLKKYLAYSPGYLGEKKKKFMGLGRHCLVFQASALPIDFMLSIEAMGQRKAKIGDIG